ncbi:hypothetical protein ACFPIJ_38215 [Dactylosporangium cerinum]|uniref:Integral membrane protein n=1 Tax=Dactylosporangium cerinum TaxID=1434730 RepID=A0ABV9W924_9ACTN
MTPSPGTALDRLLTASLIGGPVVSLVADVLYAANGWDDPTAAVFHVLGATGYILVLVRLLSLDGGRLAAALLIVGALGAAGNVGYGFNTIHVSLGDTDLVDATGAATLIKPLGLCFPLMLLLAAVALRRVQPVWNVALLAVAALVWPVAHIADIAWLAVAVNVALVAGFGAVAVTTFRAPAPATAAL